MRYDLIASQSIEINIGNSKLWDVLTNPKIIQEYLYGTQTITDWKIGSKIMFQGEFNGQKYCDMGVINENVLHELLSYSFWSSFSGLENRPENYSLITYNLESIDYNKTKFTWTQKGHPDEESCAHAETQIGELLKNIKEIAEKK
ncbi:SRPBCC domain-containing protein [Clostridium sp.]|uniref:SRPBCC domain-containing protein n=1 Tax=Clostridium sp. TaxID=1506 RepID=UPI001A440C81|nr:SRPBCC domain-containing protein [Clostridium sp.]MBK5235853.1 SRPBCC domain-containing protein [Clostridium sp.]